MRKNTLQKLELKRYKKNCTGYGTTMSAKKKPWHFYCLFCTVKWRGNIAVRWWICCL